MSILSNSYSFPVIEEGKYDYIDGVSYLVKQLDSDDKDSILLEHKITGDNLVTQLIEKGEAKYITTVVLKSAMYRETITEFEMILPSHVKQNIPLQSTFETQSFFCGVVYTGEDKEITLDSNKMGLDSFWDGVTIKLLKGSIIARDGWRELESAASDLLTIRRDDNVKYSFDVILDSDEGGRFQANMEGKLYDSMLAVSPNNAHRRSIVTHILCVGFMKVAEAYKNGDFEGYTNFKAIKHKLESAGLKTWEDLEDFDPNKVACYFLKHILPIGEDDE